MVVVVAVIEHTASSSLLAIFSLCLLRLLVLPPSASLSHLCLQYRTQTLIDGNVKEEERERQRQRERELPSCAYSSSQEDDTPPPPPPL